MLVCCVLVELRVLVELCCRCFKLLLHYADATGVAFVVVVAVACVVQVLD